MNSRRQATAGQPRHVTIQDLLDAAEGRHILVRHSETSVLYIQTTPYGFTVLIASPDGEGGWGCDLWTVLTPDPDTAELAIQIAMMDPPHRQLFISEQEYDKWTLSEKTTTVLKTMGLACLSQPGMRENGKPDIPYDLRTTPW